MPVFRAFPKAMVVSACMTWALAGALSTHAKAEPATYKIDPEHFSIQFETMHIGYAPTLGFFLKGGGSFSFDEETKELSDLEVTIETKSVFSNHERRDNHLRGKDFLNVEEHPQIQFLLTDTIKESENEGKIIGDLTILGVSKPVEVDVKLNKTGPYPWGSNYVIGVSASAMIKRSDFGMVYGVENDLVGDEVILRFEIEAIRQDLG